ncbi:MAG: hypothetical protein HQK49_17310 [Oligoflexia bacterium]|nr:hypothetical protein [Oligoflexia bacterium]
MNKQELVNQLKKELNLERAKRCQNGNCLKEADIMDLIAYTEHYFTENTGNIPELVRGANTFSLVYVSTDNTVRIAALKKSALILGPSAGGIGLLFFFLGGFGMSMGVLATWWAALFGSWVPFLNAVLLGTAITATVGSITYALTRLTPAALGNKAFESISKGLDRWSLSDEELKLSDKKAKDEMKKAV